jgi:uncharacterized protein (TIRG00374 family)
LIRILVSAGLLALVIWLADWRAIGSVLKTVELKWVSVAFVMSAADRVILNFRWQILLAARGVLVRFLPLFRTLLAANFLGSFLPSSLGVDAVRITALCRAGQPTAQVIAATLVDRATMVIATLLFGSATILVLAQTRVPPHVARFVFGATILAVTVCAAALHPALRRSVRARLLPRVPERLRHVVSRVATASLAYRHDGRAMAWMTVTTAMAFAVRIVFAKAVALSCGVDVPIAGLVLVIPILWIIVMLPITIGGLGVQEAGYVAVMSLLGVSPAVAVSMSLIEHVVARAVALPGAFFIGNVASKTGRQTNPVPLQQRRS